MDTFESSFLDPEFLSVKQAADYIGVSASTLRRWDKAGTLAALRHPANGYRYYRRADLERFRLEYQAAGTVGGDRPCVFQTLQARIADNDALRTPQREAHAQVAQHFSSSQGHVVVQIPVGCGKTGVIATLPFGIARGRVLVITPNTTIRKGVFDALDVGSGKCFWRKTGVLSSLQHGPFTAVLDGPDANIHDCIESDFVVTNIQQLASAADRWLPKFPPDFFDMILVDEGHHNIAPSWRKVFERFPDAKVVSLTATPFRSDRKQVAGDVVYRYPFTQAMIDGYIKQIHSSNVAPAEIYFRYRGEDHHHSLDEVLDLREEEWFSRGVALAEECNRHIVDASIEKWRHLREVGSAGHQIIAVACSVDHARQVRALYEERGLRAREIYSQLDRDAKDTILAQLEQGRLDCIVQVQMLGEGFDHPRLSVAAVFRPFRSLSPYIQFVGRVMRVVVQSSPGHPDNHGYVVSHVGLNNDVYWDDFRELDFADQRMVHEWLAASEEDDEEEREESEGRSRRFDIGMEVTSEIIEQFINASYLDPDDDRVIDALLASSVGGFGITLADLGMTREKLRATIRSKQPPRQEAAPQPSPVNPQKRRQALRRRLSERTRSVASRVLEDLGLSRKGYQVGEAVKSVARRANDEAVYELLSRAVNGHVGIQSKQRQSISLEQLEVAFEALDDLGDRVRDEIANARGDV